MVNVLEDADIEIHQAIDKEILDRTNQYDAIDKRLDSVDIEIDTINTEIQRHENTPR